jgi:hypothetical protein
MYFSTLFMIAVLLIINSCQKENSTVVDENSPFNANSVEKNAIIATTTFDELNNFAQSGFDSKSLKGSDPTFGSCPAISINFTTPPLSIILDWGAGCKNSDGITRSGKIIISLNGMMSEKNNVATMKIENYIVDDKKISGVTRITYMGPNAGNSWPKYSVLVEGKIEFTDKSFITYRSEYVRLLAEGAGTPSILDDTWRMEGTSSGVNKDGTKWTAKTSKVIIKKGDCKWFNSGTLVITPDKGDIKTIDFGDGTCDNKATLKVGDKITDITL